MLFNNFEKLSNDFEMFLMTFFDDLSSSSKNFERATYKGGRGALAPRPLCRSPLSQIVQTAA